METRDGRDVLGMPTSEKVLWVLLLGGGAALGLGLLPWLLSLTQGFPFIPLRDVVEWVSALDAWWAPYARVATGLILGSGFALLSMLDEYTLEVGDDDLVIVHDDDRRTVKRADVIGIYRDGSKITIDGHAGRVLFDKKVAAKRDDVRDSFVARGWPWESN